ncbi:MAG: hypothetical protein R2824_30375 [Saprospiraceae bacterium]|nr:hypothetical protein [Lewinella sp.]
MQRFLIVVIALSMSFGCATSKKTASAEPAAMEKPAEMKETDTAMTHPAVGEWDYIIRDLPDGDTKGTLSIKNEGGKYMGTIQSDQGNIQLKNLVIENKELKNATFEAQGYSIAMKGTFEGDAFTGKISAAGYDFPMTAMRQK